MKFHENIPVVDKHKYLGIIFDNVLTFISYVKYAIEIPLCHCDCAVIAHTECIADNTLLMKLYHSIMIALYMEQQEDNKKSEMNFWGFSQLPPMGNLDTETNEPLLTKNSWP